MASILKIGDKWRAQVRIKGGVRQTRSFALLADAQEWAGQIEQAAALSMRDRLLEAAKTPVLRHRHLDPRGLPRFGLEAFCGVYFLFLDGEIVYIGQALNVPNRLEDHMRTKGFDSWSWLPVPRAQLTEVETFLIRKFRPPLNITHARPLGSRMPIARLQPAPILTIPASPSWEQY